IISFRSLARTLAEFGHDARQLAKRFGHFPILYVYGRSDLTVAFFGAKVYPADLEATALGCADLASRVRSFQMACHEDERANRTLRIALELAPGIDELPLDATALAATFYRGIAASNQDFREVTRMFPPSALEIRVCPCGTGPFEGADI